MKLYGVDIHLTLSRTVEVPNKYEEWEDIDDYINDHFINSDVMKKAIDDDDYEIRDWNWNRVGK